MNNTTKFNIVSANCSFVSTFRTKEIIDNKEYDTELFPFAASDTLFYFSKFNDDVTRTKLIDLFKTSIDNILNSLNINETDTYCSAGLQELNNTEEVYNIVYNKINEINSNFNFIISNVNDEYGFTFATLGYIVNQPTTNFVKFNIEKNKTYSIKAEDESKPKRIGIQKSSEFKCYSLVNDNFNEKKSDIINIRDLGSIKPIQIDRFINTESKTFEFYVIRLNNQKPDSGRPISMIIDKKKMVVHINCHIPNPSILSLYIKNNNKFENKANNKTILQMSNKTVKDIYTDYNGDETYIDLWKTYCKIRITDTITDMISEIFYTDDFTKKELFSCSWIITGDFNDGNNELLRDGLKITIDGNDIDFIFSNKLLKTCCPNTNSSTIETTSADKILEQKAIGFNFEQLKLCTIDSLSDLEKKKEDIETEFNNVKPNFDRLSDLEKKNISNPFVIQYTKINTDRNNILGVINNMDLRKIIREKYLTDKDTNKPPPGLDIDKFDFYGDNVGFFSPSVKSENIILSKLEGEQTSDHIFVKATVDITSTSISKVSDIPSSGGRRTRRRRNGKKMMRKSRKGRRKSCRRK